MRFLLPLACASLLAACSPPPLPPAQTAKGVSEATVTLPAQPARLTAKVRATSSATLQEGGWLYMRLFANDRMCTHDESVAREGGRGAGFSTGLYCEYPVPADTPVKFHAQQETKDGSTTELVLEVTYVR